jgi:hypothetical protein
MSRDTLRGELVISIETVAVLVLQTLLIKLDGTISPSRSLLLTVECFS